jgi:hypothetical protein
MIDFGLIGIHHVGAATELCYSRLCDQKARPKSWQAAKKLKEIGSTRHARQALGGLRTIRATFPAHKMLVFDWFLESFCRHEVQFAHSAWLGGGGNCARSH